MKNARSYFAASICILCLPALALFARMSPEEPHAEIKSVLLQGAKLLKRGGIEVLNPQVEAIEHHVHRGVLHHRLDPRHLVLEPDLLGDDLPRRHRTEESPVDAEDGVDLEVEGMAVRAAEGVLGLDALQSLAQLVGLNYLGCLLIIFGLYPLMIRFLAKVPVVGFFRGMIDAMAVSYSTASSNASGGRMVGSRRASIDLPHPGGPIISR